DLSWRYVFTAVLRHGVHAGSAEQPDSPPPTDTRGRDVPVASCRGEVGICPFIRPLVSAGEFSECTRRNALLPGHEPRGAGIDPHTAGRGELPGSDQRPQLRADLSHCTGRISFAATAAIKPGEG